MTATRGVSHPRWAELTSALDSTARTLGQWLEDPDILKPPEIILPHVAVRGRVSLLSGREKIGKSTLVGGIVAVASNGAPVFGVPLTKPVTTLWYALDEPLSDTVRRFDRLRADPDRIIINRVPRTIAQLRDAMRLDLLTHPETDVVVVDTLSRVFAASGVDPNDSSSAEPALAPLVEDCHETGVAAVLLYHTGKAGREYRGSTAIGATVDEILTLRRRGASEDDDFDDEATDDGRRLLHQEGRNLRGRVHLTCDAGEYTLWERTDEPRARLLAAIRLEPCKRGEAPRLAGGIRKQDALRIVKELEGEGLVREVDGRLTAQ